MQEIFHDFLIWLIEFLAVSAGVLAAARFWMLRRRTGQDTPDSEKLPTQSGREKETPPWLDDAVMAHMALVLTVCSSVVIAVWLWLAKPISLQSQLLWGLAIFFMGGFCLYWLKRAKQGPPEIRTIRHLADLFEFAALGVSQARDLETAITSVIEPQDPHRLRDEAFSDFTTGKGQAVSRIEQLCGRLSQSLQARFNTLRKKPNLTAGDLQTLADEVHQELARRALSQATRVSRWGRYPLLAALIPVTCLLLISPVTRWALDQITGKPASRETQARPPMDRPSQNQPPAVSQDPDPAEHEHDSP